MSSEKQSYQSYGEGTFSFGAHIDHTFRWCYHGNKVEVAGNWDNWVARAALTKNEAGVFETRMRLPAKPYQYKFIVDGVWMYDLRLPTQSDDKGNINNFFDGLYLLGVTVAKEVDHKKYSCVTDRDCRGGAAAMQTTAYLTLNRFPDSVDDQYPWHGEWEIAINKMEQVESRGRWKFDNVSSQRCSISFEGNGIERIGAVAAVYDRQVLQISTNNGHIFTRKP